MPAIILTPMRWHVVTDPEAWLARAIRFVTESAAEAIGQRNAFHIVLAGGGTPGRLYQALAAEPQDWSRWHVWFGDERCLPAGHPERNSTMAHQTLLDRAPLPGGQVHIMPAERGPEQAAADYAAELSGCGEFDLVLLGLGQDGHTASLFPGQAWGEAETSPPALAVRNAPKPPPERVSLSARRLSQARRVLFLVTGQDKGDALSRWQGGEPMPAAAIRPAGGVDVLTDVVMDSASGYLAGQVAGGA